MITDEARKKLEKLPKWARDLVKHLDGAVENYKKQIEAMQGVHKDEARGKISYLEDRSSDMVVPIDQYSTVVMRTGPERGQSLDISIHESEHGRPPCVRIYGEARISIVPNSSNSIDIVPEDD